MFWSLDLDDFKGEYCREGAYPLLTAIYDAIESGDPTKTTPPTGPSTTPIDFSLHHRTNKNGINIFDMVDPRGGASSLKFHWTLVMSFQCLIFVYFRSFLV